MSEPTRGMDVGAKREVMNILREFRSQGYGVLVVASEPETVLEVADRIIVMSRGRVAAVAGLTGMIAAQIHLTFEYPEPIPTIATLGAATLLGLISGIASTRFRIPTFMTTLAMSLIAGGLNTFVSKGRTLTEIPGIPEFLGTGRIGGEGGFQIVIIVGAVTLLIGHVILRYTRFGRYVYMTGANRSAARLVGVNTDLILTLVLTICGFTAGLAGLVSMGGLGSAQPQGVDDFLINTIGAVVLGGTALTGGRGGIPQTIIGLLIYGTLRNGLDNMPWIDIYLKQFITGVVCCRRWSSTSSSPVNRRGIKQAERTCPKNITPSPLRPFRLTSTAARNCGRCLKRTKRWRPSKSAMETSILFSRSGQKPTTRTVVLKQALPYVRLVGDSWPLPTDRARIEAAALEVQSRLVPQHIPRVYFYDPEMYLTVMQNLNDHIIMRKGLIQGIKYPRFAEHIGLFLARTLGHTSDLVLDYKTKKEQVARFINPELCKITEDLVFTEPYRYAERNRYHAEIEPQVLALQADEALRVEVAQMKEKFMTQAQALIHGDLHTGSLMVNQTDTYAIDPEFAFYGPMAFDIGAVIGNLFLSYASHEVRTPDPNKRADFRRYLTDTVIQLWQVFERDFHHIEDLVELATACRPNYPYRQQ